MYRIIGGDKQEYGPSDADEIRVWIKDGRLSGESLAREESSENWRHLSTFPEFEDALKEQAILFVPEPEATRALPDSSAPTRTMSVSDSLTKGWQLWTSNFGLFVAASFTVWMISTVLQLVPILTFASWFMRGVLYGGLCLVVLKTLRSKSVGVGEVFSGFGPAFIQLALVGMLTSFLSWLGLLFCVLPGIFLGIAWIFSIPVVADKQVEFWPAMELSRKAVTTQWAKVFVLALIAFLPFVLVSAYTHTVMTLELLNAVNAASPTSGPAGLKEVFEQMSKIEPDIARKMMPLFLVTKVVLLLNMPFGFSALMCAYEDVLGTSSKRQN